MSLSQDQAAESLKEIDRTRRRSAQAWSYAHSSPFFIMWGVIWMVGYTATDFYPHYAGALWTVLMIVGFLGQMGIGRHRARGGQLHPGMNRYAGLRMLGSFLAIFGFVAATYAVFGHVGWKQQASFVPLLTALFYVLIGLWAGTRFVITGIAVAALTLGGFFYLPSHFLLWMAAVGGGALVLAGVWMRTV